MTRQVTNSVILTQNGILPIRRVTGLRGPGSSLRSGATGVLACWVISISSGCISLDIRPCTLASTTFISIVHDPRKDQDEYMFAIKRCSDSGQNRFHATSY